MLIGDALGLEAGGEVDAVGGPARGARAGSEEAQQEAGQEQEQERLADASR